MKTFEVARQFDLMADLLEIRGEDPFRIRAYRRAVLNLQSFRPNRSWRGSPTR